MTRTERVLEAIGVEVARRGAGRVWARCPYHGSERAAPFFVRVGGPRSGQNHCFSCKRGGSLVELVMHVRSLSREEATALVTGQEPPRVPARVVEREPRIGRARFRMPREVVFAPLAEWVTPARAYAERRGITAHEVEVYGLGYAVDGRLAGRIVVPWRDASGQPAGYSARSFVGEEPKYQTPAASERADRGVMFGEHLWPAPRDRAVVVVTEGALNAMAVRRVREVPVAALGGSEVDVVQIVKLSTFRGVVLLTDADAAGDKAAAQLGRMLERYAVVARARPPAGKDALDLQTREPERLVELLGAAFERIDGECAIMG